MIRNWIKGIIKEALVEWESEVAYLGRPGYKWNGENWVPDEDKTQPTWTLDQFQE